jgi:DNA-binding YbaB/EbfC family protein
MLRNLFDVENLKKKVDAIKEELKKEKIVSESGGGMVRVEANGFGDILKLEIEDELLKEKDKSLLEDLVISAINMSKEKTKELFQQKMQEAIGFLPLNGIQDLIS